MHVMISNLFLFNKTFEAPDQACHQAPQAKRTIARIATKTCQTSSLGKIYPTGCMGVMVEMGGHGGKRVASSSFLVKVYQSTLSIKISPKSATPVAPNRPIRKIDSCAFAGTRISLLTDFQGRVFRNGPI